VTGSGISAEKTRAGGREEENERERERS